MRRSLRARAAWCGAVLAAALSLVACTGEGSSGAGPVAPIPSWILYPSEAWARFRNPAVASESPPAACGELIRRRPVQAPSPIAHVPVPSHPYMAASAANNMHCDASMSDTYEAAGPRGSAPEVRSRTQGFGGYGTLAFDRAGRIVGVYSNGRGFQLELLDPATLAELASYDLPGRPFTFFLEGVPPWKYLGAGVYFYLDHRDRAVIPTTDNTLRIVRVADPDRGAPFELEREYDLADHVVPMPWPKRDSVAWVLPDWSGDAYWYATTRGMLGLVDARSGAVSTRRLAGEVVENSFAVGEDGAFVLSDRALYRLRRDGAGDVAVDWRTEYDRGPRAKPGHITRGSGTSVTILGGPDGLVAISDNAEPRIHLLFVRRSDGAVVCRVPLFQGGKSGTDVSVAGFEHADATGSSAGRYSVLVENNWGHHRFPRSHPEPGLTRVDVTRLDDGSYRCQEVWASPEKSIGVFKLSLGDGLVYMYWRSESCPITSWYFTAVDFATGETMYKRRTGTGLGYNNWAGALFLHPEGGVVYSTTIFGLVMMHTPGEMARSP